MTQSAARPLITDRKSYRAALWLLLCCAGLPLALTPARALAQASAPSADPVEHAAVVAVRPVPEWSNLDAAQKRLLEPLSAEWNSLEPTSRARWLELAARHHSMSPEEQQRLEERIASWAQLSPAERQQVRLSFQQARQIKPQDREAKWEAYQALPPERREALADQAVQKRRPPQAPTNPPSGTVRTPALLPRPSTPMVMPTPSSSLLQARPGATTVLITQHRPAPSASAHVQRRFFDARRLDANTLLPRLAEPDEPKKP